MTSRRMANAWSISVGVSAFLCAFFAAVWFTSLFYYVSFIFPWPSHVNVTRVDAGYGMIYVTLNDDADVSSRHRREGFQLMPTHLRNQNLQRLIEFELPVDWLNDSDSSFGCSSGDDYRGPEYGGSDQPWSRYWCACPIPCILFSIPVWMAWFYRLRVSTRKRIHQGDQLKITNSEQSVQPELPSTVSH